MKNLLPFSLQKEIHRDYLMRVAAVFCVFTTAACFCAALLFIPSYVGVAAKREQIEREYAILEKSLPEGDDAREETVIARTTTEIAILTRLINQKSAEEVIGRIVAEKPSGVTLTTITYEFPRRSAPTVYVSGRALHRDGLLAFREKLAAVFSAVDLPVSHLAEDKDVAFSLSISAGE